MNNDTDQMARNTLNKGTDGSVEQGRCGGFFPVSRSTKRGQIKTENSGVD